MQTSATFTEMRQDIVSSGWGDYELLDSGNQKKLERFGDRIISRMEPTANWLPALPEKEWKNTWADYQLAKGNQQGNWIFNKTLDPGWEVKYGGLRVLLTISASRHVGVFPEQQPQWDWIMEKVRNAAQPIKILNLFGYTGMGSLAAAKAGAQVTHVDASQNALDRLKQNLILSGLSECPVRVIKDDALKFIQREIRRGNRYDAILIDPPSFGRGPKGEVWKFEKSIADLLVSCRTLLGEKPLFLLATAYNVPTTPEQFAGTFRNALPDLPGRIRYGALDQKERSSGRLIHQAIYTLWESEE